MLFERLTVHAGEPALGAALNMAIDEALLAHATQPVLRFYRWARPALSFGYFGKFADVQSKTPARELVRRWTGGGIVPHGEDLTYSLITPANEPAARQGPPTIYAALHGAIRDALRAEGRETELAAVAAKKVSEACFANAVQHDLLLDGRKIAGAAQRRTRRGFLHQGSIQLPNLSERFAQRFAAGLAAKIERVAIPPLIIRRAENLAAEKYGTQDWLRRW